MFRLDIRTNDDKDLKEDVMMTIKVGIIGCGWYCEWQAHAKFTKS